LLKSLCEALQTQQNVQNSVDEWLNRIEACLEIQTLDPAAISELINKFTVGARIELEDRSVTQEITIKYRFVGNITDETQKDIA